MIDEGQRLARNREKQRRFKAKHRDPAKPTKRQAAPCRAASPIIREIFNAADAAGMTLTSLALDMETAPAVIWKYRTGRQCPDILRTAHLARCAGLRLTLLTDEGETIG